MDFNPKEYAVDHLTLKAYAERFSKKKAHLRAMLDVAIAVIESLWDGTPMPTVFDLEEALGVEYVAPAPSEQSKRKIRKETKSASSENESAAKQPKARKRRGRETPPPFPQNDTKQIEKCSVKKKSLLLQNTHFNFKKSVRKSSM